MKRALLIIGGVLGAIAALLILGAIAARLGGLHYDPVLAARQDAEIARLARESARAEALAPLDLALGIFWKLLPAVALAGGLLYLGALGVAHVARFRHERQPDIRGLLPVPAAEISEIGRAALAGYHAARIEEARRPLVPVVPHNLTYHAPHYRGEPGRAALPAPNEPAAVAPAPTFAQLLDGGRVGPGQPLMLGYDLVAGAPIWGSWRDLYSAGVGGAQGGGKSWTAASLIAQSMLNGARVILCDPHAGDEESLSSRLAPLLPLMLTRAEDERQILESARYAADELQRRRERRSADRTPLLLVIDEWTSLLRRGLGDTLPAILSDLTQEGRKYQVNALLLAQRWSVEAAGGGDVRNTLTAHYVHRTRADEARMQTGLRGGALPDDTMQLQPGQSYLVDTKGNVRKVATPRMGAADLDRVADLLGAAADRPAERGQAPGQPGRIIAFPAASRPGPGPAPAPTDESAASASGRAAPPDAETARLLARFAAGATLHELAGDLAGTSNPSHRAYKEARQRVEQLLRGQIAG